MLCTAQSSVVAGSAAVETAVCAEALENADKPWLVPAALVLSVTWCCCEFYLTQWQEQVTAPEFPPLNFSIVTDVKRSRKSQDSKSHPSILVGGHQDGVWRYQGKNCASGDRGKGAPRGSPFLLARCTVPGTSQVSIYTFKRAKNNWPWMALVNKD